MNEGGNLFLFSVDLEDVRDRIPNGLNYKERVPAMTEKLLEFLAKTGSKITFFTVGRTAKAYPDLLKQIEKEGHEIACHSYSHLTLNHHTPKTFKEDLQRNLDSLRNCTSSKITGYRAPTFSLTQSTSWAYDILAEEGIKYSSSVLPAKNPLFGWADFGRSPRKVNSQVWEIPITTKKIGPLTVPFAGGVYFRIIPYFIVKKCFKETLKNNQPILSYLHPYDVDVDQEKFMHPEINGSYLYNKLLYYNRKSVFNRLNKLMDNCSLKTMPYKEYIKTLE